VSVELRRVLFIEDVEDDMTLILRELRKGGFEPEATRVETREEVKAALAQGGWDLVIADYNLPGFSAEEALRLLQESGMDIPFIIISGTIPEEAAVSAMKSGAADFLSKDRMARLIPAVNRELRDAAIRRRRRRAEEELQKTKSHMEHLLASTPAVLYTSGLGPGYPATFVSQNVEAQFGLPARAFIEDPSFWIRRMHPEDRDRVRGRLRQQVGRGYGTNEYRILDGDGEWRWVQEEFRVETGPDGDPREIAGYFIDISARRKADQARQELQGRYQTLFQQSRDAIAISSLEGRLLECNDRLPELLETTREELLGQDVRSLYVDPVQRERLVERLEEGAVQDFPTLLRTRTGRVLEVLISAVPYHGEEGGLEGMIAITRDVTEQRRAVKQLRESETRFRQLAEHIEATFWISSTDKSQILYASPAYDRIWGRSREDLLRDGSQWMEAIHPEDRARVEAALPGQIHGEYDLEYRVVRPDGEIRWVWDRAFPIEDEDGGVYRIVGVAEDITARKAAVSAQQAAEERYRALIEHTSDAIFILDDQGRIRFTSPSGGEILGINPQELVGRPGLKSVHPQDRAAVRAEFLRLAAGTNAPGRIHHRILRRDGGVRHVESVGTDLSHVPSVGGIVVNTRDITERVNLQAQLLHSQKMEAVGQLAGGVAHDFNNLLTIIGGHAEFLWEELADQKALRGDAEEIQRAVHHAATLTRRLLAFSKRQVLQLQVLSLDRVVREMEQMLQRLLREDVELDVEIGSEGGGVRTDPGQLEQVILNLVVNAQEAMPEGGRVAIRTGRHEEVDPATGARLPFRTLSVSDNGVGIPPGTRERIFEPFFTTKPEGTGLGLSTVFGIVQQSGGRVELESTPGRGTCFRVLLPELPEVEVISGLPQPEGDEARDGETILLVEDDDALRSATTRVLARKGYEVITAENGPEGLRIASAREEPLALLLTDVVMPGMNGTELASEVVRLRPGIRVLLMSGYAESSVLPEEPRTPGLFFLPKPFTPRVLTAKVRQVLDTRPT
jgi:two-component system, cell cycle sensor histidine kinase and response regulator CckA